MDAIGSFHMADVRRKRITARRAVAVGSLQAGPQAFALLVERRLPKGDALMLAEVAGLQGAKQAATLIPLCHPLMLELVRVRCVPIASSHSVRVYCEVATEARTGVEMEALAGVSAALLTLYDLCKPIEPALQIEGIHLLFKQGGKRGLWICPQGLDDAEQAFYQPQEPPQLGGAACAVVTLSDRAQSGDYADRSGPILQAGLEQIGGKLLDYRVLADDPAALQTHLHALRQQGVRLCLCTGGTGLGPRDHTPEALRGLGGREVPGLAEWFRQASSVHTERAWLSRANAVLLEDMLVISLPGSAKAAEQALDILAPLLPHALAMAAGGSHP